MSGATQSNGQIIRRLLKFMAPFNKIMVTSLIARVIKFCGQAAVLGIAAASVGIYVSSALPGVVNWDIIWEQVGWIALFGTIVGFSSYIETTPATMSRSKFWRHSAIIFTTRCCRWRLREQQNCNQVMPLAE